VIAGIVRAGERMDIDVTGDMISSVGDAWVIEKRGFAVNETKTIFESTLRSYWPSSTTRLVLKLSLMKSTARRNFWRKRSRSGHGEVPNCNLVHSADGPRFGAER
jgi:hypothetical protein